MRRRIIINLTVTALLFSLCGCSSLYRPQVMSVPLIDRKGELRADIGPGCASVALGVTDHIAAQGYVKNNSNEGTKLQFAAGLFSPVGNKGVAELYAGYSNTWGDIVSSSGLFTTDYQAGRIQSYFLQGNYGFKRLGQGDHMELGFGLRGGMLLYDVNLKTIEENSSVDEQGNTVTNTVVTQNKDVQGEAPFLEPSIIWRFGWEHFKINISYSWSITNKLEIPYTPRSLALGLCLDFNLYNRKSPMPLN